NRGFLSVLPLSTLVIKGPPEPVVEGQMITLECRYTDADHNISQVHFEVFSKVRKEKRRRCGITEQDPITPSHSHCVLDMGELSLSREGYTGYLGVPHELKVRLGDDVLVKCSASSSEEPNYYWYKEGSDWILPSSSLKLSKVNAMDEGQYTCSAEHPSVEFLSKKRTISITVLPEDAHWYETSDGRLMLMTSAAAVALIVFILSMIVFLCRRAKQTKTSKGPIDDRSQKKPIYRASVESLPSTSGDKQPLV
uniref:Si:ch211-79k12.1 n=1 Tax=Amphilophus citrinellus TaxID=61819 RepID=A0A3Q0SFK2_AMPCI